MLVASFFLAQRNVALGAGPDREDRNEPANAALSAQQIALIKDIPEEQVREVVSAGTRELYGEF